MFPAIRLLFSANYWRVMTRWHTWQTGLVALRRFHKDKRARKDVRALLYFVFVPLLAPLSILLLFTPGGIVGAFIAMGRSGKWREEARKRKAQELVMIPPPPASAELRKEIADLALVHAVLAARAGSESFLRRKVLPEGFEVITRRVHLQVLRERGLYERLGDVERDLLLLPDGHWEQEAIDRVSMVLEPLRLLRWVLRVDFYLPTVGQVLEADYKLSVATLKEPETLFEGDKFIEIKSLLDGRMAADLYFYRCYAEGIQRGFYNEDDEEKQEMARAYAGKLTGKENDDLLLGTSIVSAASDEDVRLAATLSFRRWHVLEWVRSRMYGEVEAGERLEAFYLR